MTPTAKLSRLIHTFTFRLGLVYVGLFSASVVLLFGFIYTYAGSYLDAQVRDTIRLRYAVLADEYRQNGSAGVESRIAEMIASDDEASEIYLLVNREDERLAGNLDEWPRFAEVEGAFEKNGQWVRFNIEASRLNSENQTGRIAVQAVTIPLSKWRSLLVGQTLQNREKVEQAIINTFGASLLVTLLMALGGAAVMTRSVMRRLSVINRSAETIMQGDISARIPHARDGDEFDDLSQTLNRMLDTIEQLLQSLSQFANNIAHDLRSPLTRIISRTDAGLRGLKEHSAARKLLERNVAEMQELVGTFNSILRISELEANTEFREFGPCDLSAIIDNLVEFYEPLASEKEVSLQNHVNGPLPIEGEKNLLTQAFANLLDNAIKFTPEGGQVRVSSARTRKGIEIVIADSGPGIPDAFRDKVFEKFFRMEESRHTRGNGLGLSLVAAIARIHDAEITLEDNAPGLRVRLTFPQTALSPGV